jgi:hypothetical protein
VTVPNGTSVGILEVGTGTLATGANLVVTKILSIVGGSITSSSTSGIIHVTGTSSGGAQAIVGSVSNLGSSLSIEGNGVQGAKLNLTGGTINTNNNSQIQVLNHGQSKNTSGVTFNGVFLVDNSTHDVQLNSQFEAKGIEVQGIDGVFNAHSTVVTSVGGFTLYNGKVVVDGGGYMVITSNSAALRVLDGQFIVSGKTTSSVFTVDGKFSQSGGQLNLGQVQGQIVRLHIKGTTDLTGGKVALADVGIPESDLIECDDKITFGASYVYEVDTPNVPTGKVFLPFIAKLGFVGTPIVSGYTVSTEVFFNGSWGMYITKI